ncbi:MAG: FtsQ-type POTRA domain-containing protein [Clostridia bacterium]|nr:FtsQ-type POTRA domain-containing protein [Clostridia bacterium]
MEEELRREDGRVLISDDVKRRLQKRLKRRTFFIVFTCILVGVLILSLVGFFVIKNIFSLKTVSCPQTEHYSSKQIVEASGLREGSAIFLIKDDKIRSRILQELPLLKDLQVKVLYPDRVELIPIEEEPLFYFVADIPENEYVVVSESYKVLGMFDSVEQMLTYFPDLYLVKMPTLLYTVTGQKLEFASKGDADYISDLLRLVKESDFGEQLRYADLQNRFEITLHCRSEMGKDYRVYLGNKKSLSEKISFAQGMKDHLPDDFAGLIGAEDPQKGYADPDDR